MERGEERHADAVDEGPGGGTRAALAAVDGDPVGEGVLPLHLLDQLPHLVEGAHAEFAADRDGNERLNVGDEAHRGGQVGALAVEGRRDDVVAHRHLAELGDLGGDFFLGQQPALARLGALGEFDLDHFDLRLPGDFAEQVGIELPVSVRTPNLAVPSWKVRSASSIRWYFG